MMTITTYSALWFLPFVLPICLYVAFTDMREMRITNQAVLALGAVFIAVGLIALPFDAYLWRLAQLAIVLVVGIILNAAGAMGAGDSKFIAVAAPFVAQGDVRMLIPLFCIIMLASVAAHRLVKHTPLRRLAPHWLSWDQGKKFPMGLALASTLTCYLALGVVHGYS
jgi:prepilin peptidase CpaA